MPPPSTDLSDDDTVLPSRLLVKRNCWAGPIFRRLGPRQVYSWELSFPHTSFLRRNGPDRSSLYSIEGKAPLDAEQPAKNHDAPSTETKSQQHESRLGGLARQAELQSHFPVPTGPVLKDLPDRPNLDPNVHLDEKIDVTKNLPDGHEINSGLGGLDWGSTNS